MPEKKFPDYIIKESKQFGVVNYSLFCINDETIYSSVLPYHFYQISKIIRRFIKSPKFIIDANAHIGGSTINLTNIFPTARILSIEIKKSTFNLLKKNISSFECKRVVLVNENCIPFFKKLVCRIKPDFINLDPPWGGPGYNKKNKMMLTLKNTSGKDIPIYSIINFLFLKGLTRMVTFKAPNNFDLVEFKKHVQGKILSYSIYNKKSKARVIYKYMIIRAN